MTIACVLKSGGDFDRRWAEALRAGMDEYAPRHTFACLTDTPSKEYDIPLTHGWPKWWAKLELFRPGLFSGKVFYCDLDTLPVGDLGQIASYDGPLAMLNDFYRPARAQSGVMIFTPSRADDIWNAWMQSPADNMRRYRGDGEWLHAHTEPDRLQDLFPGQIVSLKAHCNPRKANSKPPKDARLLCGHGRPRFSDPRARWAHEMWRERI